VKTLITLALVCLLPYAAAGQTVLVWDADDGDVLQDPLGAGEVGTEYSVVRALQQIGLSPTVQTTLPASLAGYDIVFVCTGWYDC